MTDPIASANRPSVTNYGLLPMGRVPSSTLSIHGRNSSRTPLLSPGISPASASSGRGRLFSSMSIGTNAEAKYALHCVLFISWIAICELLFGVWASGNSARGDPIGRYGLLPTLLLYFLRLLTLFVLPQCLCNALGLLLFNGFREEVKLKTAPMLAPFVCFRVVTRGDYPELVRDNLNTNLRTCFDVGLENFIFEVVTDKALDLPPMLNRVREVVVPKNYRTKSGARYKARALQYCLEDEVNILRDEDWIVHLDEETLLTQHSVCGILNFCEDGRHQFGQGIITYAGNGDGKIVNWLTTLSDTFRVADDMGKLRLQFSIFHKPLFGWKGSFVVSQAGAEKMVSFDHGPKGSIAEDCFFSMIAFREGYSFDFIEGEMLEKSPFTCWDFLQQRKRWLQGIYLTVHDKSIPWRCKFFLACSLYAWITMPVTTLQLFLCPLFPLPKCLLLDALVAFVGAVNLYMYVAGVLKSFSHKYRQNSWRLVLYVFGVLLAIPFNLAVENLAVILGSFSKKDEFYVVKKEWRRIVSV